MNEALRLIGPMLAALVLLALITVVTPVGRAQSDADAGSTGSDKLTTDEAVRTGMEAIRRAVIDNHTLITHRRFPPPMAAGFNSHIKGKIKQLRTDSRAPSRSLSELDKILEDILKGAGIAGLEDRSADPIDGLALITGALEDYAGKFDHPGWKPLHEQ